MELAMLNRVTILSREEAQLVCDALEIFEAVVADDPHDFEVVVTGYPYELEEEDPVEYLHHIGHRRFTSLLSAENARKLREEISASLKNEKL